MLTQAREQLLCSSGALRELTEQAVLAELSFKIKIECVKTNLLTHSIFYLFLKTENGSTPSAERLVKLRLVEICSDID